MSLVMYAPIVLSFLFIFPDSDLSYVQIYSLISSYDSNWRRKWQPAPLFLPENPTDRGAGRATVHGVTRIGHDLATKPPPPQTSCFLNIACLHP